MNANPAMLVTTHPTEIAAQGTWLQRRNAPSDTVIYIELGRVALGIASPGKADNAPALEHRLGVLEGPCWLDASSAVLNLPSAVDALAETEVAFHHVPLAELRASMANGTKALLSLVVDVAHAHRQQTDLVVSRLAKDAEARCAEWLLNQVQSSDKGVCSVHLQQRKRLIAAQLGIAPETLSRVLRHLRERRLISGSGRVVNLVDMSGLRSLAGS